MVDGRQHRCLPPSLPLSFSLSLFLYIYIYIYLSISLWPQTLAAARGCPGTAAGRGGEGGIARRANTSTRGGSPSESIRVHRRGEGLRRSESTAALDQRGAPVQSTAALDQRGAPVQSTAAQDQPYRRMLDQTSVRRQAPDRPCITARPAHGAPLQRPIRRLKPSLARRNRPQHPAASPHASRRRRTRRSVRQAAVSRRRIAGPLVRLRRASPVHRGRGTSPTSRHAPPVPCLLPALVSRACRPSLVFCRPSFPGRVAARPLPVSSAGPGHPEVRPGSLRCLFQPARA